MEDAELVELCHVGGEGHGTHEERLARETRFTRVSSVLTVRYSTVRLILCSIVNSTDCKTVVHVIIDVLDVHVILVYFHQLGCPRG